MVEFFLRKDWHIFGILRVPKMCQSFRDDCISNDPFWPCFDLKFDLGNLDADGEAAETIKQAQSERARGIQNLQDQLKEAKMMQDKQEEQLLFEKVIISLRVPMH